MKQLKLEKPDGTVFIFRYSSDQASELVNLFAEMASEKRHGFDWFDAAVLSHQIGRDSKFTYS